MRGRSCSSATRRSRCRRSRTSTGASPTSPASIPTATRLPATPAPSRGTTMLEIDASGVASVGETGITIENAPEGIRFELLTDDHPLLGTLVGHTREVRGAQRGDVGARPARARPEGRRRREADLHPDREHGRGRLAVLAAPDRRRGAEPLHGDRGVHVRLAGALRLLERRGRDRRRGRRQGRVRLGPEPLAEARGTSPRITPRSVATPSSTGSRAASARAAARCGSRTTSPARARRRA